MATYDGMANKRTSAQKIEGNDRCYGWEELPNGPLIEIAQRLFNFQDLQVMQLVCSRWYSLLRAYGCEFLDVVQASHIRPQVPWLMMAEQEAVESNQHCDRPSSTLCLRPCSVESKAMRLFFYSLSFQRVRDLVIRLPPELELVNVEGNFKNYCLSSSHGWLLVVRKGSTMCLYSPFAAPPQNYIPLPRHDTLSNNVKRFSLSASPCTQSYMVMIAYGNVQVAFWRPGDKGWTLVERHNIYLELELLPELIDVIVYRGYCYALDIRGDVYRICSVEEIVDFAEKGGDDEASGKFKWKYLKTLKQWNKDCSKLWRAYFLVVEDKLLVVVRLCILGKINAVNSCLLACWENHMTGGFIVMEIVVGDEVFVKEVESLGNKSLFVGRNQAFAIEIPQKGVNYPSDSEASCYYGCKPNHIYFTDDRLFRYPTTAECGKGTDKGVYNMADGSIERHFQGLLDDYSPMLWVEPRC